MTGPDEAPAFDPTRDYIEIWSIYYRPADYPDRCVTRRWLVQDGRLYATGVCYLSDSIAAARLFVPPGRYVMQERDPNNPQLIESWL